MRELPGETYHERITWRDLPYYHERIPWRVPFFHIHRQMPCIASAPRFSKKREASVMPFEVGLN